MREKERLTGKINNLIVIQRDHLNKYDGI